MRVENSVKNLGVSWVGYALKLILSFIARSIFIKVLNQEYLGINGLFTNILSLLSLAELGVGSAIIFSLYKPIHENDTKNIVSIMQFYKKVYTGIGIIIGVLGISLMPFLGIFIKDIPNISNLKLIYGLYVFNTAVSYFFVYKSAFITANQKNYIVTLNTNIFNLFGIIFQTVALIVTSNFIFYLIIQVIFTILGNANIARIANNMYPFLKNKNKVKLDKNIYHDIIKNTGALVLHKIGGVIVFSTDNVILSKIVGLVSVGLYSNYSMILNSLESIMSQVFTAISASVGDLGTTKDTKKKIDMFYIAFFTDFWIYSFASVSLIVLFNPLIKLWVGENYILGIPIVLVLILNFYIKGMRNSVLTFKDAFGLFWYNKYMPIGECIINLGASILLAKMYGTIGVFIGTTISSVATCLWIEPKVLYKYGFKVSIKKYIIRYIIYFMLTCGIGFITYMLCDFLHGNTLIIFISKLLICLAIPNIIVILIFCRTKEFKYLWNIFMKLTIKIRVKIYK
ncbi:lipopolysaccharide biosynthesis protein [Clostridium tyrobutyricum]|uniref:lipopolysaccharide biosynthesis protein n=1 Tax=Clostridium tyrobutyricum TaxID=1519 RepID=UPI00057D8241|nr:oligosaccharide flippase family protein [Clostridium tyrobutyricum]